MRRSAREVKKPDVLTYAAPVSESESEFLNDNKKSKKNAQPSRSSILRKLMSDGDDEDEQDDLDEDEGAMEQVSSDVIVVKGKKKKRDNGTDLVESTLFEALQKNKKLAPEIDNWLSNYKSDKISAMVELINFVLSAAGAERNWIEPDVDLEALESEEIDELLEDMIKSLSMSDGSKFYPLNDKKSKGKSFRDKYILFWESLVQKIRLIPQDVNKKSFNSYDILLRIVEQLVSLSTIGLVNIRDAVSEAAFCIANVILSECQELKEQVEVAQRQMNAEETKSKGVAKQNPKYQAYLNQKNSSTKDLKSLMEICDSIFNTIFIHRFKDAQSDVRLVCIRHINEWILFDLKRDIKVEYLKYLGWACNDHNDNVRLEAIQSIISLLKNEKAVKLMQNFVNTFINRFVEMAYGDNSDSVLLNTIVMLREFQKCGLLDSVSEQTLDIVDSLIFDNNLSARIRQEALSFVLDHTEGFDEITNAEAVNESTTSFIGKSNSKNKKGSGTDESKALMQRQKVSLQLETLSEFAEYHKCHNAEGGPEMLAEACLAIPNFDIFYDWNSIIALLLRESDELITTALRPPQISILLKMFIKSSIEVKQRAKLDLEMRTRQLELNLKSNKSVAVNSRMVDIWESLTENLHKSLPLLLTRYRDDESNLQTIVFLFDCCDYSSNHKALKPLLKVVTDIFLTTSNKQIIQKIIESFKSWQTIGESVGEEIENTIKKLFKEIWSSICSKSSKLQNLLKNDSKKSKKRTSEESDKIVKEDLIFSISSGLCKYRHLWSTIDCRCHCDQTTDTIIDELVEVIETISSFTDIVGNLDDQLEKALINAAISAEVSIEVMIYWMKYDLLDYIKRVENIEEYDNNDSQEEAKENLIKQIETTQESIIVSREKAIDVLSTWMSVGQVDENESVSTREVTLSNYWRALRCEAFRSVANFRIIFCSRESKTKYLDKVIFQPSQDVLSNMRHVFESEGMKIKNDLAKLNIDNEEDVDEIHKLTTYLVNFTLLPLTQSLSDIESLNRRQAASIVYYLLEANDEIDECVKFLLKQIKDSDPIKLLEVQMVALKGIFAEYVLKSVHSRLKSVNSNESVDLDNYREVEEEGFEKLELLAKRLSSMLGVGKLKGALLDALCNFFKAGIIFSFSDINQIGFLDSLGQYVKFLPPADMKEILSFFDNQMNTFPDLVRELESDETSREYQKYISFLQQIQGQGKARMLKRKSLNSSKISVNNIKKITPAAKKRNVKKDISLDEIDEEEDIEIDENDFSPLKIEQIVKPKSNRPSNPKNNNNNKSTKAKSVPVESSRKSNRAVAQKMISYADDDEDDDDEFEELLSEINQSSQSQSTFNIKNTYSQNSKMTAPVSQQSKTQHDFAMGLDIQDVGNEEEEEEDEEEENIFKSQKAISQKSINRNQFTQSENTKKRNLIAAIEDNDDDDDELDNLPARRRFS